MGQKTQMIRPALHRQIASVAIVVPPAPSLLSIGAFLDSVTMARAHVQRHYGEIDAILPSHGFGIASFDFVRLEPDAPRHEGIAIPLARDIPEESAHDVVVIVDYDAEAAHIPPHAATRLGQWLRERHAAGALIAASGASVALVAASGLLDGRAATGPWWQAGPLRAGFPRVRFHFRHPRMEANGVLTTAGASADPRAAIDILERIASPNTALWLSRRLLPQHIPEAGEPADDPLLARAQQWLAEHYSTGANVEQLAKALGVSRRTLSRHFAEGAGTTPHAYLQMLRIEAAKRMLERSPFRIDRIANLVGYADAGFFRETFRKRTGISPREWRRAHRSAGSHAP